MSFAIQSQGGKHLGFLLMSGDSNDGDCIFRSLPAESAQFETQESELIFQLQQLGEFQYSSNQDVLSIRSLEFSKEISIESEVLNIGDFKFKVIELESS